MLTDDFSHIGSWSSDNEDIVECDKMRCDCEYHRILFEFENENLYIICKSCGEKKHIIFNKNLNIFEMAE